MIVSKAAFLAVAMRKSNLEPSKFFLPLSHNRISSLEERKKRRGAVWLRGFMFEIEK